MTDPIQQAIDTLKIIKRQISYGPDYAILEGSAYDRMVKAAFDDLIAIQKTHVLVPKEPPEDKEGQDKIWIAAQLQDPNRQYRAMISAYATKDRS